LSVAEKALKLVTPTASEARRLDHVAKRMESMIKLALEGSDPVPEVALGGSYARGTWLKGSFDIDYFMLYPPEYPREKLEEEAVETAKRALEGYKVNLRFAEHPYVEGFVEGIRVNLVPCYKVLPGEWKSAADRSPYHTKYMVSKLDDNARLEARLLKKFVKAANVYGAEVRVQGFSGYVCEVLTLKYGSFKETLEALAEIGENEIISVEPYDERLAKSFKSPLVILDPVDTTRNLGAAISPRNVAKLVFRARNYIENPGISFFKESERGKRNYSKVLLEGTIVVSFKTKWRSPDILWGQLKRSAVALANKLESHGFQVLRTSVASDESSRCAFLFLLADEKISIVHARKGPDYFRADEVKNYFEKNRKRALFTWIGEDGKLESTFLRQKIRAHDVLGDLLSKKNIGSTGVSQEIKEEIARGFVISSGKVVTRKGNWLSRSAISLVSEE
jgi:tRNA nucleotidyltransferase (CCA-adding enzyme)